MQMKLTRKYNPDLYRCEEIIGHAKEHPDRTWIIEVPDTVKMDDQLATNIFDACKYSNDFHVEEEDYLFQYLCTLIVGVTFAYDVYAVAYEKQPNYDSSAEPFIEHEIRFRRAIAIEAGNDKPQDRILNMSIRSEYLKGRSSSIFELLDAEYDYYINNYEEPEKVFVVGICHDEIVRKGYQKQETDHATIAPMIEDFSPDAQMTILKHLDPEPATDAFKPYLAAYLGSVTSAFIDCNGRSGKGDVHYWLMQNQDNLNQFAIGITISTEGCNFMGEPSYDLVSTVHSIKNWPHRNMIDTMKKLFREPGGGWK